MLVTHQGLCTVMPPKSQWMPPGLVATQMVGGLQSWPRSAAGPDVCIEGWWQTETAASGGWRELWEEYMREKSTSRHRDIPEKWVCENSNLVKNVTYSTNGVKNNHRAQTVFEKDKKFVELWKFHISPNNCGKGIGNGSNHRRQRLPALLSDIYINVLPTIPLLDY